MYDTKKFKQLQKKWYGRLEKSGFEDIENEDGSLKATTDSRTIKNSLKDKLERETYDSVAREFLNTYEWPEITEKLIWAAHVDNMGMARIAKMLHITYYMVRTTIVRIQKLAKLRKK